MGAGEATLQAERVRAVRTPRFDLGTRPFLVLLELTRACDLACRHCRAEAASERPPGELSRDEVAGVLDDLAALGPPRPIVVLTGGDPFKRDDVAALVAHGARRGLAMAISPSGTPLATPGRLRAVRRAGARTVSLSIDGAVAARHDAFRGVEGSYEWTLRACRAARREGLRLQVNTTVTATTVEDLPGIARLVTELGAGLWSVFFVIATGRGRDLGALDAEATEDVLHVLHDLSPFVPLKTTEAPQYRRVFTERARQGGAAGPRGPLYEALAGQLGHFFPGTGAQGGTGVAPLAPPAPSPRASGARPPLAVGDGRGVVFVSHTGDVSPSGFLPLVVGNVRESPLSAVYREAELLRALRDPGRLGGRCGRCEFRTVCGGSRARAYAASGDPLGEDPSCPYVPGGAEGTGAVSRRPVAVATPTAGAVRW